MYAAEGNQVSHNPVRPEKGVDKAIWGRASPRSLTEVVDRIRLALCSAQGSQVGRRVLCRSRDCARGQRSDSPSATTKFLRVFIFSPRSLWQNMPGHAPALVYLDLLKCWN